MTRLTTLTLALFLFSACGLDPDSENSVRQASSSSAPSVLDGCYMPRHGRIRAAAFSATDALGTFQLLLERRGPRKRRAKPWLLVRGQLKGTTDPATGTAAHVQGSARRTGFLFTAGDTLAVSKAECVVNGVPQKVSGVQTLRYTAGSGIYAGLLPGGTVLFDGTINGCPTDPAFGRVDFVVIAGKGQLCFKP